MSKINDLTKAIMTQAQIILDDALKAQAGNKAAARRVRKATIELGNKCGKDYRAESVKVIG